MDVIRKIAIKIVLTALIIGICIYIGNKLEFFSQWKMIDNLVGGAPFILLFTVAALLIGLIWKKQEKSQTSTIVLSLLSAIFSFLFIPSITGNWYPFANVFDSSEQPSYVSDNTELATLPNKAAINILDNLPKLDGATAIYPVYASFANAVYDKVSLTDDRVVCTNTPNAYNSIILGGCDIIFVAGPSEKQKQAAKDANVNLVYTPIGKEAFVFLVGKENPIGSISKQQIKNIYSGKTANWKTFGWSEGDKIIAFQRPEGSGSQTGLQGIMRKLPIQKPQPLPDSS